jgi:predicted transcriptional regulator
MTRAKRVEIEAPVTVEETYDLTEEQEAFIEASIAEIERGEYVTLEDFMREVRAVRAAELGPEEAAEIDAAMAEADLGGGVPADEVLRELRARR